MKRFATTLLLAVALMTVSAPAFAQCAMCKTALQSPEGRKIASAYRKGILFLLPVPFIALGTVAVVALRGQKQIGSAASEDEPEDADLED